MEEDMEKSKALKKVLKDGGKGETLEERNSAVIKEMGIILFARAAVLKAAMDLWRTKRGLPLHEMDTVRRVLFEEAEVELFRSCDKLEKLEKEVDR